MNDKLLPNIALSGKSGSGKTTVAKYLVDNFNYQRSSSGSVCRSICNLLYGSVDKTKMNLLTTALKSLDSQILIRAALLNSNMANPVVFDSLRFKEDFKYFQCKGYITIRLESNLKTRIDRLSARGEIYNRYIDDNDVTEIELDDEEFDFTIFNDSDTAEPELLNKIKIIIGECTSDISQ